MQTFRPSLALLSALALNGVRPMYRNRNWKKKDKKEIVEKEKLVMEFFGNPESLYPIPQAVD